MMLALSLNMLATMDVNPRGNNMSMHVGRNNQLSRVKSLSFNISSAAGG